jgi:hypothetical protein
MIDYNRRILLKLAIMDHLEKIEDVDDQIALCRELMHDLKDANDWEAAIATGDCPSCGFPIMASEAENGEVYQKCIKCSWVGRKV